MMSSMGPRGEDSSSKTKKNLQTLYDERMTALQASRLPSGIAPREAMHSDTELTPSPKPHKNK